MLLSTLISEVRRDIKKIITHDSDGMSYGLDTKNWLPQITKNLTTALRHQSTSWELYHLRSEALMLQNELSTAYTDAQTALSLLKKQKDSEGSSSMKEVLIHLANIEVILGNNHRLAEYAGQLIRQFPGDSEGYFLQSKIFIAEKKNIEAVKALKIAVTKTCSDPSLLLKAYTMLGQTLLKMKKWQEAINTYENLIAKTSGYAPWHVYFDLGVCYQHQNMSIKMAASYHNAAMLMTSINWLDHQGRQAMEVMLAHLKKADDQKFFEIVNQYRRRLETVVSFERNSQ